MIARSRVRQETLWRAECRIDRPAGIAYSETTGDTTTNVETVYEGRCQFRPLALAGIDAEVGEHAVRLGRIELKLPANTDVQIDDFVTATSSTYDDALPGQQFRVTDVPANDWQVTRTCTIEAVA
jgi:hypothetical protein